MKKFAVYFKRALILTGLGNLFFHKQAKANTTAQQKVQDPLTKEGVVGLFNRTYYPISKALD